MRSTQSRCRASSSCSSFLRPNFSTHASSRSQGNSGPKAFGGNWVLGFGEKEGEGKRGEIGRSEMEEGLRLALEKRERGKR